MSRLTGTGSPKRFAKVLVAVIALPLIALVPAFVASVIFTDTVSDVGESEQIVSSTEIDQPAAEETVMITMSSSSSSYRTYEATPGSYSGIEMMNMLGGADLIKITVQSGREIIDDDGQMRVEYFDADSVCQFYLDSYDSDHVDGETFVGYVRVEGDERTFRDDECVLYWVDALEE